MVAISLYRGNLHKVPDVPRRWLMPNHTISIKDFKSLVRKREKALSLLLPSSNPNPNFIAEHDNDEFVGDNGCSKQSNNNNLQITLYQPLQLPATNDPAVSIKIEDFKGIGDSLQSPGAKSSVLEGDLPAKDDEYKQQRTSVEIKTTELQKSDKGKKKIDLEEKLKGLNERKHKLVQMLKQILNAEEEIKRRSSVPIVSAPCVSQHVDGEPEDKNNYTNGNCHINPQQTLLYSPTPSTPSPLRMLSHASSLPTATPLVLPPTCRPCQATDITSTCVASSPMHFAPPSGNPPFGNLTPILSTMSATIASSPSPVASGGTSVFRDPRITSPWS